MIFMCICYRFCTVSEMNWGLGCLGTVLYEFIPNYVIIMR